MTQNSKKILVLRFSAMGDVAMTIPVIKSVVEQNTNVEIIFVSRRFFAPFFKDLPQVTFYGIDLNQYKGIYGLYKLYKELKGLNPDEIADLHDVLRTKILRNFFKISGFSVHVIDKGRKEKKALTQQKNKIFKALTSTFERYAEVFRKKNLQVDLTRVKPLNMPELTDQVRIFLQTFQGNKLLGVAPFAAHQGKQYPLDKMRKVIELILEKDKNADILLFGGGNKEKELLGELEKINRNRVVNTVGIFSLDEELQIISRLDKMLGMDSGNGHLAAMFGVPVFTIWGATHPYAGFAPFGQLPEKQFIPDLNKFPQIPTSVYGNKIFPGFEKIWKDIPPEIIVEKLIKN